MIAPDRLSISYHANMNSDDEETIDCSVHGDAYVTYICDHLIDGLDSDWYSTEPEDESDWPSAWCGTCHQHFLVENEWNEKSEAAADISNNVSIICHFCYEILKDECTVHYI